jgi:tripartite ATP-independent transporter DctM subunit
MTAETLIGLVMLIVMIGAIFIGIQISFALLFLALTFGYLAFGTTVFDLAYFQTIGLMKEELLAAVPLFIFMGYITEQAGLMERLFSAFRMVLAPVRRLIPPSVMLIVMGPVLGVSVADLYASAFGPGFLLAGIYLVYLIVRSTINPKLGPPVPKEKRVTSVVAILREVAVGVLPLLLLIAATLGSILAGLATPTEASAIGALGALILAIAYRRLTYAGLKRAVISATTTSSMVLLLAVTSNIFGAVFARTGTANWVTDAMVALPVPPIVMLGFVIILLFLLGWPFEWPAIILVFLPIFYPVVDALRPALSQSLGIQEDLFMVWFGSLVAVTMQTAFLSPPVAMSAYYLKQVVKEWSLLTIYKGMFEFMVLQCIAIAIVMFVPSIATKLPEQLRSEQRAVETQDVDDSMNRLEEDPLKGIRQQNEEEEEKTQK